MERREQKKENTWAVEDIFPDDIAWEENFEAAKCYPAEAAAAKGTLGRSAADLLRSMQWDDKVTVHLTALRNYAFLKYSEDIRVAAYQVMQAKISSLWVEVAQAGAYRVNELLNIPEETLEAFYAEEPALEQYRLAIHRIRRRKEHILSDAEENILAAAQDLDEAGNIYSLLTDSDLSFADAADSEGKLHPVTAANAVIWMRNADPVLRKNAYDSLYDGYGQFENTCASILNSQMKTLLFHSKLRHYENTLEAALDYTEVPPQVYYELIGAVRNNLPKLHRYAELRKKLLGVEELHFWDIYAPMVPESQSKYTFEEAKELVLAAVAPLGEEYQAIMREGFENRWIDVYANAGKDSGAYSNGGKPHPYVLLNYEETLNDVFVLAHEMGHAIHSYLSEKHQTDTYSDYVIFVAEVASTCNEALLMEYLLSRTESKQEEAGLINYFLEQFRGTLYRQTMFAEFELEANRMAQRGVALTAEALDSFYAQLNRDYFGEAAVVDDKIACEWTRIPHFYGNYYVYQYATGYAAAIALSRRILKEGDPAVKDYLGFLSGGSSADPITLLRGAGVDMATPAPVNDALELFGTLLDRMERLAQEL